MEYPLLEKIESPRDIQAFTQGELLQLAAEMRRRIIDVMSVNGGHLASNLGSVELTIALHQVFRFARRQIHLGCQPSDLYP